MKFDLASIVNSIPGLQSLASILLAANFMGRGRRRRSRGGYLGFVLPLVVLMVLGFTILYKTSA